MTQTRRYSTGGMRWSRTTYPEATVLQTADAAAHLITSLVRMVGFEPTRLLKTTGSQPMLSTKFSTSAFASSPTTHAASLFNHIAVEYPLSAYVMGLPILTGLPVRMCDVSLLTIEVGGATHPSRCQDYLTYVSSLSVWTSFLWWEMVELNHLARGSGFTVRGCCRASIHLPGA